jgi:sterol desaturase/sphingolipid hydroxylase (fatty acid hydroxylase superfamily)
MARRYVSNKNETVRMFESNFMEFFSHVHPVTPLVIYIPVIIYMLYLALVDRGLSIGVTAGMFFLGAFLWTFIEYFLHRFVFHYKPSSVWGQRIHFIAHGVHHDYPNDGTRLVMPPSLSLPLAFLFYYVFYLVFGSQLTPGVFAGMVFGYLCYDMLHYATHHFSMKTQPWLFLKQYHLRHHYKDEDTGYGVSSPFWDYIFRTVSK